MTAFGVMRAKEQPSPRECIGAVPPRRTNVSPDLTFWTCTLQRYMIQYYALWNNSLTCSTDGASPRVFQRFPVLSSAPSIGPTRVSEPGKVTKP